MLFQSSQRGEPDDPKNKAPHDLFNYPPRHMASYKTHQIKNLKLQPVSIVCYMKILIVINFEER